MRIKQVLYGLLCFLLVSCADDLEPTSVQISNSDEINHFVNSKIASMKTFDNVPMVANWKKALVSEDFLEVPLDHSIHGIKKELDHLESRIIIPLDDPGALEFISLESNKGLEGISFKGLMNEPRKGEIIRWEGLMKNWVF